jgi:cytochrome c-type biogenesis protein CcmH/NrfF
MPAADRDTQTSYYPRSEAERALQHELVCTCGACGHTTIAECRKDPCPVSHQMRGELAAMLDEGKTHDQIIQAFVQRYGSEEMLGAPIDKGFNRLVWLLPWTLAATGAIAIGFAAVKWSKHDAPESIEKLDPATDERLDDELRNLD